MTPRLDRAGHGLPPRRPIAEEVPSVGPSFLGMIAAVAGICLLGALALWAFWMYGPEQTGYAPAGAAAAKGATAAAKSAAPAGGTSGSQAAAPAEPVNMSVEIIGTEFKFAPATLKMDGPGTLNVTLKNDGVVEHDILFEGVEGRVYARGKQTESGSFTFDKGGSYAYFCSIPGHRDAGMVGTLTVAGGAAAAAAPQPAAAAAPAPAPIAPAVANVGPLPQPAVAPPVNRSEPALVKVEIDTVEVRAQLADGQTYTFWTFGGTVPGPMVRVRQGDTVEVTLKNLPSSVVTHSIDFHATTGPGGGAKATQVAPGESATFRFKATNPGVYVYHCATPMVAHHISSGMYGLIVVEPPGGFPKVDREFYVMQGDLYVKGARGHEGHREFSVEKMLDERPDFVLFNGSVGALTGDNSLKAKVGETVRIFFGVGGPNITSSFHVIGEIFDTVYPEGSTDRQANIQTTLVPTGGSTVVDFKVEVPGTYVLVDHSLGRLEKGAAGFLIVEGPENPEIFEVLQLPAPTR